MPVTLVVVLILINIQYGFLLFHSIAELLSVIIGITMFAVAWNNHGHTKNYFLLYLGTGYFWIAVLDLFHLLSYKGMPFFDLTTSNVAIQFWIYARTFEALLMLSATLFFSRKFNPIMLFICAGLISTILFYLALYQEQPLFFVEGKGLTLAKVVSEYIIILILMIAIFIYWRTKHQLTKKIRFYLISSLVLTITAELFFTQYADVYGFSNQVGHIFKILSFLVIYAAIVQTMLKDPFSLLTLAAHSYDAIPQPALVINNKGLIQQANQSAKSEFNITDNGKTHFHKVSHNPKISQDDCAICQHLVSGNAMPATVFENPLTNTWQLISLTPLHFTEQHAGFIQITLDITKSKEEEKRLRLANIIFDDLSEGVVVTDANRNIVNINKAYTKITGYSAEEVINKNPRVNASGRHSKAFFTAMWQQLDKTDHWQGEIWNKNKQGEVYPELLSINALRSEEGEVIQYVGVFSDISKMKSVENKLRHQAHHDLLTGLPNRLMFISLLKSAIKHSNRNNNKLALLFVDIDNFKSINDSLGHSVGDTVLINVGKRIKSIIRESDVIGRYGGDEFLILLEDIHSNDGLADISEKLINSLVSPIFHYKDMPIFVSISMGICVYPDDAISSEQLIQYSDAAMYKAKAAGKNNFIFHSSKDNEKAKRRLELESQLRQALANNEIYVVYQPKIDAKTYQITGAEALIRWSNAELGEIYPDEFIPLAESIGEIHELGKFVLSQALEEVTKWREITGRNLSVAVNFSSKQFVRLGLDELIEDELKFYNLPSNALEVEITESLLINKDQITQDLLQSISNSGISIAIDDFGTGYSSLSYLKNYPINVVKIDKSFIDDVTTSSENSVLVKTIILMAHGLGMSVVAEGVEEKEQLSFYQQEQGDIVQGYYFSKPVLKDDFISLLSNWDTKKYSDCH